MELLKSKKMFLSLVGVAAVVGLVLAGRDIETVQWGGGFIAGIVASLNPGQGWPAASRKAERALPRRTSKRPARRLPQEN